MSDENGGNRPTVDEELLSGSERSALHRVLDQVETLRKRLGMLQLEGVVKRCADATSAKAALQSAPPSKAGSNRAQWQQCSRVEEHSLDCAPAVRAFEKARTTKDKPQNSRCLSSGGGRRAAATAARLLTTMTMIRSMAKGCQFIGTQRNDRHLRLRLCGNTTRTTQSTTTRRKSRDRRRHHRRSRSRSVARSARQGFLEA